MWLPFFSVQGVCPSLIIPNQQTRHTIFGKSVQNLCLKQHKSKRRRGSWAGYPRAAGLGLCTVLSMQDTAGQKWPAGPGCPGDVPPRCAHCLMGQPQNQQGTSSKNAICPSRVAGEHIRCGQHSWGAGFSAFLLINLNIHIGTGYPRITDNCAFIKVSLL